MKHIITSGLIKLQPGAWRSQQQALLYLCWRVIGKESDAVSNTTSQWVPRTGISLTPPLSSSIFLFLSSQVSFCHLSLRQGGRAAGCGSRKTTGETEHSWSLQLQPQTQGGASDADRWINYSHIKRLVGIKLCQQLVVQIELAFCVRQGGSPWWRVCVLIGHN